MPGKISLLKHRLPMYLGGLLIGLALMVAIFQAKKAMMPKFHEVQESRDEAVIAPGGGIRFAYSDDPAYFLIPGLPTGAVLYKKNADGTSAVAMEIKYGQLVEKEVLFGPITEEGRYSLDADFYICAEPGVADCTKLTISHDLRVERNASQGESRIEIDLTKLAQDGLKAGNLAGENEKNHAKVKDEAQ